MATRKVELELEDGNGDWFYPEFEVQWTFDFTPGKYSGRPEDCYPDEEESELYIEDMEQLITNLNPSMAHKNIKHAYDQLGKMGEQLPEWTQEEAQSRAEDAADFAYECERDRRMGLWV